MKMVINCRGNGACPICKREQDCSIKNAIEKTVAEIEGPKNKQDNMEAVIYTCPYFKEKN